MIPLVRSQLPQTITNSLTARTGALSGTGSHLVADARRAWSNAGTLRRSLKAELERLSFRAAFCMYCYESRGTDVDHFEPINSRPKRTFDWSNHLLACGFCNQQAKREAFPKDSSTGRPLLLDPFVDDSAVHMTMGPSGAFIDLTPEGQQTIELLRLNDRAELVQARAVSWRTVVAVFGDAAREARPLNADDIETLQMLPVVDAFHHFAHDISRGGLVTKAAPAEVVRHASSELPAIRALFPGCGI